jgi:hypothetical protein
VSRVPALPQAAAVIARISAVDLLHSTKAHVMVVIEHAARRIHVLGATTHPTHARVTQQAGTSSRTSTDRSARFAAKAAAQALVPELAHVASLSTRFPAVTYAALVA